MNFENATIRIFRDSKNGPVTQEEPGKILPDTGLGYWIGQDEDEPPFYKPTHIPTGSALLPEPFFSEEIAQQFIERIAPLYDWNKMPEEMRTDGAFLTAVVEAERIYKELRFEDAAETAGGGRW